MKLDYLLLIKKYGRVYNSFEPKEVRNEKR